MNCIKLVGIGFVFFAAHLHSVASAAIIGSSTEANMEIRYNNIVDVTDTDSGATSASVDITGPVTGATAHSHLELSPLTSHSAVLNFDLGYDGNGYVGSGFMGGQSEATLTYEAIGDTTLNYAWDFEYLGPNPFGLQIIRVYSDNVLLATLGDFGQVGSHQGADTYELAAGAIYDIETRFLPNVSGGIGSFEGHLHGDISFEFAEQQPIPEPSSLLTFAGLGLCAGLGAWRRRRKQAA